MENVIVGRTVHIALSPAAGDLECRPLLLVEVHSKTVVSGRIFLSPRDRGRLDIPWSDQSDGVSAWMSSVTEEPPRTQSPGEDDRREPHLVNDWHDPRLC